jgi:hypothetical protein
LILISGGRKLLIRHTREAEKNLQGENITCIGECLRFKYPGEREIINSCTGDTEKITKKMYSGY